MPSTPFPPDEFDELPAGSPVGAHRRIPRTWTRLVVFFGVILVSIGLAWGAAKILLSADDIPWLNWLRPENKPSPTASVTPSPTDQPSPSPSASVSPSDPPVYDFTAVVVVFDQSGVANVGAEAIAAVTTETDFTSISAGTWTGAEPPANVVRYRDAAYEDSAKLIAEVLGIPLASLGPLASGDIAVILVSDPSPAPAPSASASP